MKSGHFNDTIKNYPRGSKDKDVFICMYCHNILLKGRMPPLCHSNNLEAHNFDKTPELRLSELENSLICKTLVFMKIFNLPGVPRMQAIKDQMVHIPLTDEDSWQIEDLHKDQCFTYK